jgi:hypothetical protein
VRSGTYVRSNVSGFSPTNDMPCRQRLQDTVATIIAIAISWIVSTVTRCYCIGHVAEIRCDRDSPLPLGEFRLHNRQWYSCNFPSLSRSSLLKIWQINLSAMTQASVAMMLSSFFLFLLSLHVQQKTHEFPLSYRSSIDSSTCPFLWPNCRCRKHKTV